MGIVAPFGLHSDAELHGTRHARPDGVVPGERPVSGTQTLEPIVWSSPGHASEG